MMTVKEGRPPAFTWVNSWCAWRVVVAHVVAASMLLSTVHAKDPPAQLVADFTAVPTSGPVALTVAFSDASTGGNPLLFLWDFGDGGVSTQKNPTHTYLVPGSYTVSLTASGGIGVYDNETKVGFITVYPPALVVDFSASPAQGVNPLGVSFTDDSTGATGTAWSWDFGDGGTSSLQNPTHTYVTPGTYDVALTVFVVQLSDTLVQEGYITVAPAPLVVDFEASPLQGVNPLQVAFNDASTGATTTAWTWDFGDGATSTLQNPTHTYAAPGTFTVLLRAFVGQQSAAISKADLIKVAPAPLVVDFSAAPTQGVNPVLVSFADTSTGAATTAWSWDFGDGGTSLHQNPTHTYTAPGSHTVSLTAFVGQQGSTLTQADLITVDPAPLVVDFSASPTQGVSPLPVSFTDSSTGAMGTAWSWDFGDGSTSSSHNPTHIYTVAQTTSFTVSLTVFVGQQNDTLVLEDFITVEQGPFGPTQVITEAADGTEAVHAADLDGDGDTDVFSAWGLEFMGGYSIGKVEWYANTDGLGSFSPPRTIADAGDQPAWLDAADIDGDGDTDVLFAAEYKLAWYANTDGLGNFGPQQLISTAGDPEYVEAVDLDGDGDVDVLYASFPDDRIAWFENTDGLGSFGPADVITTAADGPLAALAADLDGDGDADVLSASAYDDTIAWYENTDGLGSFGPQQVISTSADWATSVHAADLDGDGDVDVLSSSYIDDTIAWYENTDGLGSFGPQQVISTAADSATRVHATDLDGDGDADVLSSSFTDNKIAWYENTDGLGSFGPQQVITTTATKAKQVDSADLDGDGDADVLSASYYGDNVAWYPNTLASPAWPFLGNGLAGVSGIPVLTGNGDLTATEVVTLTLTNALPGGSTALVIGLSNVAAPFKGGVLVPNPDIVLAGLPIGAIGNFVLTATWPAGFPGGATVWFQHWINDPAGPQGLAASNGLSGTTSP